MLTNEGTWGRRKPRRLCKEGKFKLAARVLKAEWTSDVRATERGTDERGELKNETGDVMTAPGLIIAGSVRMIMKRGARTEKRRVASAPILLSIANHTRAHARTLARTRSNRHTGQLSGGR